MGDYAGRLGQRAVCRADCPGVSSKKKIGWSYSTVKTMMDRMVSKGLLKTQRMRNLILYSSAITKKEAQKRRDNAGDETGI